MRYLISGATARLAVVVTGLTLASCAVDSPDPPHTPDRSQPADLPEPGQLDKEGHPGLSTTLNELLIEWDSSPQAALDLAVSLGLEIEGDRVKIMLIMLDDDSADAAELEIAELDGEVIDRYQTWIDAWVPIGTLEKVAAFAGLSQAQEPIQILPLDQ